MQLQVLQLVVQHLVLPTKGNSPMEVWLAVALLQCLVTASAGASLSDVPVVLVPTLFDVRSCVHHVVGICVCVPAYECRGASDARAARAA